MSRPSNDLERVRAYLAKNTPMQLVDRQTHQPVDLDQADKNAIFAQGDFRLISYEWGVTYAGFLNASKATGDSKFADYTAQRMAYIKGLAACQSGEGCWHQLLDRNDSYLETSATAIYTYCIARAVNRGWIDPMAYGPVAQLGWNAVSTRVNAQGQVEGTCVGTGMAFDPAFYTHRPVNVYAAHSYGPVLLAGAEIIEMTKQFKTGINDSAFMVEEK